MMPILCDIPIISYVELNKPKIEYVSCITTLEREENNYTLYLGNVFEKDINMYDFSKYLGTTLTSKGILKTTIMQEELIGLYSDDYDLVVKFPSKNSITRKVKIKSITKFTPKIVL